MTGKVGYIEIVCEPTMAPEVCVFRVDKGTPVRLAFKTGKNPYEGKRNKLTPRQERKRSRLMKRVKK